MSQSLSNILVHAIWSTKGRAPVIAHDIRPRLHGYIAGILAELGCPAIIINSVADPIHVLCVLSKNLAVAKLIEQVKVSSSKWMKAARVRNFHWQSGYGIFSVSESNKAAVRRYIEGQQEHHRRRDFQSEFRAFCRRHGVALDERYVWD